MADSSIKLDSIANVADFCVNKAREIELEIECMGVALGVDWDNEIQVQELAKEALHHAQREIEEYENDVDDYHQKAKVTLFGLAYLMMDLMAKSAAEGIHTHGGIAWKAFSKALMKEKGMPMSSSGN